MPLGLQAEMLVCGAFVDSQWHKVLNISDHHLIDRLRPPFHSFARIWIGRVAFAVVVDRRYLDRATARHKLWGLIGIIELPVEVVSGNIQKDFALATFVNRLVLERSTSNVHVRHKSHDRNVEWNSLCLCLHMSCRVRRNRDS